MPATAFDASKYLTDLGGRDYLEVKWRLLWLRTEHPDAIIETELVKHTPGLALFRARVAVPGAGTATGWGSETASDFEDYIEKAETKALGRALAALGYGTQFCEDFDFSADRERPRRRPPGGKAAPPLVRQPVVDAPVALPDRASDGDGPRLKVVRDRRAEPATTSQVKAIYSIGRDHHESEGAIDQRCRQRFGRPAAELSKRQASEFIDLLRRRQPRRPRPRRRPRRDRPELVRLWRRSVPPYQPPPQRATCGRPVQLRTSSIEPRATSSS